MIFPIAITRKMKVPFSAFVIVVVDDGMVVHVSLFIRTNHIRTYGVN